MSLISALSRVLRPLGIAGATLMAFGFPAAAQAQGDLLVAPTRLVLDGRQGGEIILSNIGSEEATYRVTLELRRMTPEGELVPVEEGSENDIEIASMDMIRYAPRRVVLPPNQPQAIRVSARPGADLPDGEYRVHMSFSAIPKPAEVTAETAGGSGLTINLVPIYGITMPIIVRKGNLEVVAGLADPQIIDTPQGPAFALEISRGGQASLYGDLVVYRQGADEPVFLARGIGVYPEISGRRAVFGVPAEVAAAMRGPVRVEFREPSSLGGGLITSIDAVIR